MQLWRQAARAYVGLRVCACMCMSVWSSQDNREVEAKEASLSSASMYVHYFLYKRDKITPETPVFLVNT